MNDFFSPDEARIDARLKMGRQWLENHAVERRRNLSGLIAVPDFCSPTLDPLAAFMFWPNWGC